MSIYWCVVLAITIPYLVYQINNAKEQIRHIQIHQERQFSQLLDSIGESLQRLRTDLDELIEFKKRIESEEKVKKK